MSKPSQKSAPAAAPAGKSPEELAFEAARDAGLSLLKGAGVNAAAAGTARADARAKGASALDATIAGLTAPGVLTYEFAFDVCDRGGNVVDHVRATLCDYARGFKNADGSDSRATEGAFRAAMLPLFFGVAGDQSAGAKSVWATFGKAFAAARALVAEGMAANIVDGKLTLEGGTGAAADALRGAKSTSALVKAAKGATGTGGSDSGTGAAGETRAATPSEICAAAAMLTRKAIKGEEALCDAALSCLRQIAKLVADNPEAFAED